MCSQKSCQVLKSVGGGYVGIMDTDDGPKLSVMDIQGGTNNGKLITITLGAKFYF